MVRINSVLWLCVVSMISLSEIMMEKMVEIVSELKGCPIVEDNVVDTFRDMGANPHNPHKE